MNITYLHGEPAPRKELEPFDVVQGSFHAQLYDINSLLDLPLANVRKLWKIMLSAAWENEKSIDQVRGWLPRAAENAAEDIRLAENALKDAKTAAAARHSENAAMGDGYWQKTVTDLKRMLKNAKAKKAPASVINKITRNLDSAIQHRDAPKLADRAVRNAQRRLTNCKARQEKLQKLQAIFDDMAAKAKI